MSFTINFGDSEMLSFWQDLKEKYRFGTISKNEEELYKKFGNAIKKISEDPFYPSLHTHEIKALSKRYGVKVWQSYVENNVSKARRIYWVYGPSSKEITIIGFSLHPESDKNGAYDRIKLAGILK